MSDKSLKRSGSPIPENDEEDEEYMVLSQPAPVPKPSYGKGIRIGGKKFISQPDLAAKSTIGGKKVARAKKKLKMSLPLPLKVVPVLLASVTTTV